MDNIGSEIGKGIMAICVIVALVVFAITSFGAWMLSSNEIRSDKLISPKIELVVKDNVLDTVYVYKPSN